MFFVQLRIAPQNPKTPQNNQLIKASIASLASTFTPL